MRIRELESPKLAKTSLLAIQAAFVILDCFAPLAMTENYRRDWYQTQKAALPSAAFRIT
jgi:hypothetical protein